MAEESERLITFGVLLHIMQTTLENPNFSSKQETNISLFIESGKDNI